MDLLLRNQGGERLWKERNGCVDNALFLALGRSQVRQCRPPTTHSRQIILSLYRNGECCLDLVGCNDRPTDTFMPGNKCMPLTIGWSTRPFATMQESKPIDSSWNLDGLGSQPNLKSSQLQVARMLHWSGPHKPWMAGGFYQGKWAQYYLHMAVRPPPLTTAKQPEHATAPKKKEYGWLTSFLNWLGYNSNKNER